jgi:hypothetical protein
MPFLALAMGGLSLMLDKLFWAGFFIGWGPVMLLPILATPVIAIVGLVIGVKSFRQNVALASIGIVLSLVSLYCYGWMAVRVIKHPAIGCSCVSSPEGSVGAPAYRFSNWPNRPGDA